MTPKSSLLHAVTKSYGEDLQEAAIQPSYFESFSDEKIDEFLDYCDRHDMFLLIHTLADMSYTLDDEPRKFWYVTHYINLKNLTTSLEYILKTIAQRPIAQGILQREDGLGKVVKQTMRNESWIGLFNQNSRTLTFGHNEAEFRSHLIQILQDPQFTVSEDSYWARSFLIACLARNLTVHTYPTNDVLLGDFLGVMIRATKYCILNSWLVAKREQWI